MPYIDQLINYLFADRWKLNEPSTTFTYTIPKNQVLNFNENNELILLKNPTHYVHHTAFQYNVGFTAFFIFFNSLQVFATIKLYKKLRIKKILLFGGVFTYIGLYEAYLAYSRVKDPYEILLKDGKRLVIKTYQDEFPYEMDISDMRILSPKDIGYYTLVDSSNKSKFMFFYIEPSFGNVSNRQVFNYVFEDKRYLKYSI